MPVMEHYILVFIIGVVASFVGSFAGGTISLISMSSLLAIGIPAHLAVSVFRVGATSFFFGGFFEYLRKKTIIWKSVLLLTLISIPTAYFGAKLSLSLDEAVFEKVLGVAILIFLPLTFFKKDLGVLKKHVTKGMLFVGYFLQIIIRFISGLIPAGGGVLETYNLMYFFGFTIIELKAVTRIPLIVGNIIGFVVFASQGIFDLKLSIFFAVGTFLGGFIGARYVIKTGNNALRYVLMATILIVTLQILIF